MNHSNKPKSHSSPHKNPTMKQPIFKRHAEWRCMQPSCISLFNKYKPKMLQRVTITNLHPETLGMKGLRSIRKALKDSKTIASGFLNNSSANVKQLTYLLDSTNQWKSLAFISIESFFKIASTLGKYKKLSNFTFPYISKRQHILRKTTPSLYQQLKKLHKQERLSLDLPLYGNPSILKYRLPWSLKSLGLSFKKNVLVPQQQLSYFAKGLQRCHLLEEMSLSFSKNYKIESSGAQLWASFFQNTPPLLKRLKVSLRFSAEQQSESLQIFIESLKYLKNITSLSFTSVRLYNLNQPLTFLDDYFSLLFTSLQSLTQLKALELNLSFHEFNNDDIQSFASMLQCLKNLKELDISLPDLPSLDTDLILRPPDTDFHFIEERSPEADLTSIAESFRNLKNLETLDIKFINNFSKKSMQILFDNIAHLPLTSFCLDPCPYSLFLAPPKASTVKRGLLSKLFCFSKKKINPTPFFSDLQNFTQLSTLTLKLSSFDLSNHELKCLGLALQKFKQLSSLTLSLPQLSYENNFKGLRELGSCFKNLPKLTSLDLNFEGAQVSNQEVKILSSHLAGCSSLTNLNLKFKKAYQLNDKALDSLQSGIRGLSKLKFLTLLFEGRNDFGEKALSDSLRKLMVLKDLSRFYFVYDSMSMYINNRAPLPAVLQGYENLRFLENFVVGDSRYI